MNVFKCSGFLAATVIILGLVPGCASGRSNNDLLVNRVSKLVDETTKSEKRQGKALKELETLGSQAVPYLVGHLQDIRPLAKSRMSFAHKTAGAFEGLRHYSPDTVHDALSAVLNQVTGKNFVFVYNGATPQEREENRRKWVVWCQETYPIQAARCNGEGRKAYSVGRQ